MRLHQGEPTRYGCLSQCRARLLARCGLDRQIAAPRRGVEEGAVPLRGEAGLTLTTNLAANEIVLTGSPQWAPLGCTRAGAQEKSVVQNPQARDYPSPAAFAAAVLPAQTHERPCR